MELNKISQHVFQIENLYFFMQNELSVQKGKKSKLLYLTNFLKIHVFGDI